MGNLATERFTKLRGANIALSVDPASKVCDGSWFTTEPVRTVQL